MNQQLDLLSHLGTTLMSHKMSHFLFQTPSGMLNFDQQSNIPFPFASGFLQIRTSGIEEIERSPNQQSSHIPENLYDYKEKLKYIYGIHGEFAKLNNPGIYVDEVRSTETRLKFPNELEFLGAQLKTVYQQDLCEILLIIARNIAQQKLNPKNQTKIDITSLKEYIKRNTKELKQRRSRKTKQTEITKSIKKVSPNLTTKTELAEKIIEQLGEIFSNENI